MTALRQFPEATTNSSAADTIRFSIHESNGYVEECSMQPVGRRDASLPEMRAPRPGRGPLARLQFYYVNSSALSDAARLMRQDRIDCVGDLWIPTEQRLRTFASSQPILIGGGTFVVGSARPERDTLEQMARVYVPPAAEAWLCFVCAIGTLLAVRMALLAVCPASGHRSDKGASVWNQLRQAVPHSSATRLVAAPPRRSAVAVLTLTLSATAFMLLALYQKILLTELLREMPHVPPRIDKLEPFLESLRTGQVPLSEHGLGVPQVTLVQRHPEFWFPEQIRAAQKYPFDLFAAATKQNGLEYEIDLAKLAARLNGGKGAGAGRYATYILLNEKQSLITALNLSGRCNLHTLGADWITSNKHMSLLCDKNGSHSERHIMLLNKAITETYIQLLAVVDRYSRVPDLSANFCKGMDQNAADKLTMRTTSGADGKPQQRPLGIEVVVGAFALLGLVPIPLVDRWSDRQMWQVKDRPCTH